MKWSELKWSEGKEDQHSFLRRSFTDLLRIWFSLQLWPTETSFSVPVLTLPRMLGLTTRWSRPTSDTCPAPIWRHLAAPTRMLVPSPLSSSHQTWSAQSRGLDPSATLSLAPLSEWGVVAYRVRSYPPQSGTCHQVQCSTYEKKSVRMVGKMNEWMMENWMTAHKWI